MESRKQRQEKIHEYCKGCLRYVRNDCDALKVPFPLWSKRDQDKADGQCWARIESKEELLDELYAIRSFHSLKNGETCESVRVLSNRISKLETEVEEERKELVYADLHEVYLEDLHRGEKGGGGEKADRTNKSFGPQQMKDNRFAHRKNNPRKYNGW
jgi:hypothetical protein